MASVCLDGLDLIRSKAQDLMGDDSDDDSVIESDEDAPDIDAIMWNPEEMNMKKPFSMKGIISNLEQVQLLL